MGLRKPGVTGHLDDSQCLLSPIWEVECKASVDGAMSEIESDPAKVGFDSTDECVTINLPRLMMQNN